MSSSPLGASTNVLVVEDEIVLRMRAVDNVEDAGFTAVLIPSIAAALSSTLIAMTAVQRIKRAKAASIATLPDEAVAYLFGPLVEALKVEAQGAVNAAMNDGTQAKPPPVLKAV